MRLTCLKCGHQVELATGDGRVSCACGAEHSYPDVHNTGTAPNEAAAERSRFKAFRAAGVVRNIGGFALGISLLGILFFPLGLVGAGIGVYCLTMLRGPLGRYSGRTAAILAVSFGAIVFVTEGLMALSWLEQRRVRAVTLAQEQGSEDLKRLRRAQRLYRATHDTYGSFSDFRFKPSYGKYTIYLSATEIFEAEREGQKLVDPLPEGYEPAVSVDDFTAVAVADLDGDPALDIWVMTAEERPMHITDDLDRGGDEPPLDFYDAVQGAIADRAKKEAEAREENGEAPAGGSPNGDEPVAEDGAGAGGAVDQAAGGDVALDP